MLKISAVPDPLKGHKDSDMPLADLLVALSEIAFSLDDRVVIALCFPHPAPRSRVSPLNGCCAHNSPKTKRMHVHVDALVLPSSNLRICNGHNQYQSRACLNPASTGTYVDLICCIRYCDSTFADTPHLSWQEAKQLLISTVTLDRERWQSILRTLYVS